MLREINLLNILINIIASFIGMEANMTYLKIPIPKKTTIPRHPQLDKLLAEAICKQLEIPKF